MANGKNIFLVLAFILLFGNFVFAADMSGGDYEMYVGVDGGGGESTGGSSILKLMLGTISGIINSTNMKNLVGFFYGASSVPQIASAILSSTSELNVTTDNLTVSYELESFSSADSNVVTDWRKNGESLAVLNMPFDISNGTTFKDYSSYENNGSCSGDSCPTWTSDGKVGGAMEFDGVDDVINSGTNYQVTNELTLSAWIKISSYTTWPRIVGADNRWIIYLSPDGLLRWYGSGIDTVFGSGYSLLDNQWHHVCVTYKDGENIKAYIDGDYNSYIAKVGNLSSLSGTPVTIGNRLSLDRSFNGSIDEVQIYNYSLSEEQIMANYQAGLANHSNEVLVSQETTKGENYTVALTPNYQSMEGDEYLSNYLYIENTAPVITDVTINSTDGSPHQPGDNLSIISIAGASDDDNDEITNTTDWRESGTSLAVLNMPFNTNESGAATDYSTYQNNGTCTNCPTWTSNGVVGGAYVFDGVNDYIDAGNDESLQSNNSFTISFWVKMTDYLTSYNDLVSKGYSLSSPGNKGWAISYAYTNQNIYFDTYESDGTRHACTKAYPQDSDWHKITITFESNLASYIYIDNSSATSCNYDYEIGNMGYDLKIGSSENSRYLNGSIDEVQIYDYALTPEQIQANYQAGLAGHSNDLIVSQEIAKGENYTVAVTPTDGEEDGNTVLSNSLYIDNQPPTVTLTYPLNENLITTDRKPTFTWTCNDPDVGSCTGDNFKYEIFIKSRKVSGSELCSQEISGQETTNNQYKPTDPIKCLTDYNYTYDWAVRAYDGYEWGEWDNSTFNMTSLIDIRLEDAVMDFGRLAPGSQEDTTDDNPSPFNLFNDGNVKVNITYNATPLWLSQNPPEDAYQMKIRSTPANWLNATSNWFNIDITPSISGHSVIVDRLNYSSSNNFLVDIGLNVASDEPSGNKQSIITFIASLGEPDIA